MFYFTFFFVQVASEGTNTLIHHPKQGLSFQNNVSTALSSETMTSLVNYCQISATSSRPIFSTALSIRFKKNSNQIGVNSCFSAYS